MADETVVTEETPAVEAETTPPSTSETETTLETEEPEADTLVQPAEEGKGEIPRSQKRIQELVREKNEAREEVDYWKNLVEQAPEVPPITEEFVTAGQVADEVLARQEAKEIEKRRADARKALRQDINETIAVYPELETDDDKARAVFGYARETGISLKAAADWFFEQTAKAKEEATRKVNAEQTLKSGVSSPRGAKVSRGEMPKPDLSSMSEQEKATNWSDIIASYTK